uniref:Peptidase M16 C-terminal domain-containing protein n=1 Tax=Medicago truncatula TaxID=3880 RepID=B7FN81_MEDTR|nr:unknown [Medicago truncatula]
MYRATASSLKRHLKGGVLGNLGATRFATSSAIAAKVSSGGLFSWLTGERSSSLAPLDTPISSFVLQMLMGGGGSFSAGGPGKGMHSRLFLRVLNEYQQIQSFSAFNSIFNNTGLFGIYASTSSDFAPKAVELAAKELIAIATPEKVPEVQLDRAKKSTKTAVLMNLESRMIASEDIGRQILTYGERKPVEEFLKAVDEITLDDITKISQRIISSPLTMASYGDVINVPSYENVSSMFHAK